MAGREVLGCKLAVSSQLSYFNRQGNWTVMVVAPYVLSDSQKRLDQGQLQVHLTALEPSNKRAMRKSVMVAVLEEGGIKRERN